MQEIFSQIKYYRQKEGKFYEKTFEVVQIVPIDC